MRDKIQEIKEVKESIENYYKNIANQENFNKIIEEIVKLKKYKIKTEIHKEHPFLNKANFFIFDDEKEEINYIEFSFIVFPKNPDENSLIDYSKYGFYNLHISSYWDYSDLASLEEDYENMKEIKNIINSIIFRRKYENSSI